MAQNEILINFKGKGDEKLIASIERLAAAQNKLNRASRKSEKSTGMLDTTHKRNAKTNGMLANSFSTLRSKMLLVSFGAGLVAGSVGKLVRMYGEQEKAQKLLARQLGGTSKDLLDFASAQQKVTTFGDEVTISAMATAAAFTKNESQIKELTQVAMDYAVFSGKDLNQAVQDVSKSVFSSTNLLSRQGIAFEGTVGSADRFNSAMDAIREKTGGLAEEEATTLLGALTQTGNALGDLGENIGSMFVPIVNVMSKAIRTLAEHFDANKIRHYTAAIVLLGAGYAATTVSVSGLRTAMKKLSAWMTNPKNWKMLVFTGAIVAIAELADKFGLLDKAMDVLNKAGGQQTKTTKEMMKEKQALNLITQEEIFLMDGVLSASDKHQIAQQKALDIAELKEKGFATELEHKQALLEVRHAEIAADQEAIDKAQELFDARMRNAQMFASQYSDAISSVQGYINAIDSEAKADELKAAKNIRNETQRQKKIDQINEKYAAKEEERAKQLYAFKLSSAISNVALGITQTWADKNLGFWGKVAATAFQATAGIAQIGTITAQTFEQGGLVGGRRHSQGGTIIEAEQGEFVMSRNATEAIGIENLNRMNQGGGGAVNITFTGNVMSQDFIEQEAIPQIKEAIRRGADIGVS